MKSNGLYTGSSSRSYEVGYREGMDDAMESLPYGTNLMYATEVTYCKGYNEGYKMGLQNLADQQSEK